MIGIGAKLDKTTKIKIMAERAHDYNQKYDRLIAQGLDPEQTANRLQQEEFHKRHQEIMVDEPYKVPLPHSDLLPNQPDWWSSASWLQQVPCHPLQHPKSVCPDVKRDDSQENRYFQRLQNRDDIPRKGRNHQDESLHPKGPPL